MNNVQPDTSNRALEMDTVEDAILARWEDPVEAQVSEDETEATSELDEETVEHEDEEEETTEIEDEGDEDQDEDDEEETSEEEDTEEEVELSDETEVEILVDGEVKLASIKDLKRLYGQEKSLTRKSQEVAQQRKEANDTITKSNTIFQKLIEQAQERYKPYQDVDMLLASKSMSTEDFALLRKEAQDAQDNLKFLTEEADAFFSDIQAQQQKQLQEAAKECVKVLEEQIPEWNNQLYNEIRSYAVSQGLPEDQVNTYVDPVVLTVLHKARLYDQGKKVATVKKKQAVKKKVLRSQKAPQNEASKRKAQSAKMRDKLRSSRDVDDLADVILSRWAE